MEIWKEVKGYEGLYEASNLGNIKRLPSVIRYKSNGTRNYPGKMLIQERMLDGYLRIVLSKNGNHKRFMSHRLIAETFIPNPYNKPYINHKNGVKSDNRIENLEWCSQEENEQHAVKVLGKTMVGKTYPCKILCIDTGITYKSMKKCVEHIGHHACIEGLKKAINANRKYHGQKYVRA
jgi:hypothetical protein